MPLYAALAPGSDTLRDARLEILTVVAEDNALPRFSSVRFHPGPLLARMRILYVTVMNPKIDTENFPLLVKQLVI